MSEVVSQQTDFRVGQIVRWDDAGGTHHGRVSAVTPNGATVFIDDLRSRRFHQVRADRLALVQDAATVEVAPALVELPMQAEISLAEIRPSRWQPRAAQFDETALLDLAMSIKELGLVNPVTVFALGNTGEGAGYELVAGERRVRASIALAMARLFSNRTLDEWVGRLAHVGIAGLGEGERAALEEAHARIRATVELPDLRRLHKVAVIENIERAALTPLEEARAFQGLMTDYGWSGRQVAAEIGKSQGYVSQRLQLLELPESAQEAVANATLGIAHARAIVATPEPLRRAVSEWTVRAVNRDDSPASTREVEHRARQVAAFVDPQRWIPDPDHVVTPEVRNYLAMVRWMLETEDLAQRASRIMELDPEVLKSAPERLAEHRWWLAKVCQALYGQQDLTSIWETFAESTNRTCATCRLGQVTAESGDFPPHCPRWVAQPPQLESCTGWIGREDPVVIPAGWGLTRFVDDLELPAHHAGFGAWFDDVDVYVDALQAAMAYKARQQEQDAAAADVAFLRQMRRYLAYQKLLSPEDRAHAQAHVCEACVHYMPLYAEENKVPCHFAQYPLRDRWGQQNNRAPEYGLLLRQDGVALPRCEKFRRAVAAFTPTAGVVLPDPEQAVRWLATFLSGHGGYGRHWSWGVLGWLPYPRKEDMSTDLRALRRWLHEHWEVIDGGAGVATLIDVAISELAARDSYQSGQRFKLLNPVTLEEEIWIDQRFTTLYRANYRDRLPEGWLAPWEVPGAEVEVRVSDEDRIRGRVVGLTDAGDVEIALENGTVATHPRAAVLLHIPSESEEETR